MTESGLRERKKQRTREAIADAAARLFARHGFDAVTVADVARAADVSTATVFNYFPTKEDLFYGRMEDFGAALVEAVRSRAAGEPAVTAFRRFVLTGTERLAEDGRAERIAESLRIVAASGPLRAREREVVARSAAALADLIAAETGASTGDVEPLVVASALFGAQQALVEHVHRAVVAGLRGDALATSAREQGERAFDLLERGLLED